MWPLPMSFAGMIRMTTETPSTCSVWKGTNITHGQADLEQQLGVHELLALVGEDEL